MNISDYQKAACRTSGTQASRELNIAVSAMGLAGELSELVEALFAARPTIKEEVLKEVGDVLWYVADLLTLHGLDMSLAAPSRPWDAKNPTGRPISLVELQAALVIESGKLVDGLKKSVGHGVPLDHARIVEGARSVLDNLGTILLIFTGLPLEQAAEANIAKLNARYKDGFVKGGGVR